MKSITTSIPLFLILMFSTNAFAYVSCTNDKICADNESCQDGYCMPCKDRCAPGAIRQPASKDPASARIPLDRAQPRLPLDHGQQKSHY